MIHDYGNKTINIKCQIPSAGTSNNVRKSQASAGTNNNVNLSFSWYQQQF